MTNIPNTISTCRIATVPVLLFLAWYGYSRSYVGLLIIALLSDTLDGYLARKLNQKTQLGARLDSWGDLAIFISTPICAWWLWPGLVQQEAFFVALAIISFLTPAIYGFIKYKRLPCYHTHGAKLTAVLLGISAPLLFIGGPNLPFRISTVVLSLTALEEICITTILPAWHSDVPSLFHAIRIKQNIHSTANRAT